MRKMARAISLHKKDIKLDKRKLKEILDSKGMSYIDFYEKVSNIYGEEWLDLTYKGFMSLMSNRSSWKLLYAVAMVETLNIRIKDVFEIVDIDIEKKVKEKERWKEKYEKDK